MKQTTCILALACWLSAWPVFAGISLSATRLVVEAGKRDTSLTVKNTGTEPFLAQSWLQADEFDDAGTVNELWVTPPVVRIDGGREALIRILPLDISRLPKDRESVFYLNVQQVPQANTAAENKMVLAIRQRIKVFFRPEGLTGEADKSVNNLLWIMSASDATKFELQVENPSVFSISFASTSLYAGDILLGKSPAFLLKPFERRTLTITRDPAHSGKAAERIHFDTINDFGVVHAHDLPIGSARPRG
ncbi:molecular chaperone [Chitinimonas sp.]|uniref:fimbrial biogenesis chaperone n=1 Tax=Chitinimonas sp. TaxID=1934313 RepID=UPI0035AF3949